MKRSRFGLWILVGVILATGVGGGDRDERHPAQDRAATMFRLPRFERGRYDD